MPPKGQARQTKKTTSAPKKPAPTVSALQDLHDASKQEHIRAPGTTKNYGDHVARAQKWVQATEPGDTSLWSRNGESACGPEDRQAFRSSLEPIPNAFSPKALALYLSFKIFYENLGESTADGIYSAFKNMWKHSAGDKYRGVWHFNEHSNEWRGNPADSACVQDIKEAIKHKCGANGGDRRHSLAMSKMFMEQIFNWSIEKYPADTAPLPNIKKEAEHIKHIMYRAFSSLAFSLWTRNIELVTAKRKQVTFDLQDEEFHDMEYTEFRLTNRKGWQRKTDKSKKEDELKANEYRLYEWESSPACDGQKWLREWVNYLETHVYRHALEPEDYLFPAISANGIVQRGEHVTHDTVQKWINEFTTGANVRHSSSGQFTTHCFRRGGAQYRFMFATGSERWPLHVVRWWGGWAEGENRETLIKYLLDELHTYETNCSDAMRPVRRAAEETFMGDGRMDAPPTTAELRVATRKFIDEAKKTADENKRLTSTVEELKNIVLLHFQATTPTSATTDGTHQLPAPPNTGRLSSPAAVPRYSATPIRSQTHFITPITVHAPSAAVNVPTSISSATVQFAIPTASQHLDVTPNDQPDDIEHLTNPYNLCIPDIPLRLENGRKSARKNSWREIVAHWLAPDPARWLHTAFKDWPEHWLRESSALIGEKYHHRRVIAQEYIIQYNSNEERFLSDYPEANMNHTALRKAINRKREERGELVRRVSKKRRVS